MKAIKPETTNPSWRDHPGVKNCEFLLERPSRCCARLHSPDQENRDRDCGRGKKKKKKVRVGVKAFKTWILEKLES